MEIRTAERLDGVGEYYFSAKLREIENMNRGGDPVINLGIGSPDLPPHPSVIKTLEEEAAKPGSHAYQGYKGVAALRNAIADWYKKFYNVALDPATEILPLIGSKEGVVHICMTYLGKGDEALVPDPGYPTYKAAVQLAGAKAISYELKASNNWEPDFDAIEATDLSKVKIMWLNYPHMPTGRNGSKMLFEKFLAFAKKHNILLCHDNPYSFILNEKPLSLLEVEGAKELAIELNSLSKSHNMAGWRIGMLCGAKQRIEEVLRFKSNMDSGMFLPVQLAAAKALSLEKDWFENLNAEYKKRREKVYEVLDLLKCSYAIDQSGLFIWALVNENDKDGFALSDEILKGARVFITPGGIFGSQGEKYLRISLCNSVETFSKAIAGIKDHLNKTN
jgi:LL-diaminopimelate aminotransferase